MHYFLNNDDSNTEIELLNFTVTLRIFKTFILLVYFYEAVIDKTFTSL